MIRSLEEIEANEKELAAEKKQALKEYKKNDIATLKKLISITNLQKVILEAKHLNN
ncbi:hypothetical protein N9364_00720 [Alphaproteobacteria bacterium]|nr:hypothetical protein [Alphaproteobacteria bacterium]